MTTYNFPIQFKTEVRDTHGGDASYGAAFVRMASGAWALIGHTRNCRTYPRAVRARSAAEAICRTYARKHFPLHTFTSTAL